MTEEADRATLDELSTATAEAERAEEALASDSSNNPNKHHARRQAARERVRLLTRQLKIQGDLPVTKVERMAFELERMHPEARHGDTVEHFGQTYRRHCAPARVSRTGNPISWDCTWVIA